MPKLMLAKLAKTKSLSCEKDRLLNALYLVCIEHGVFALRGIVLHGPCSLMAVHSALMAIVHQCVVH